MLVSQTTTKAGRKTSSGVDPGQLSLPQTSQGVSSADQMGSRFQGQSHPPPCHDAGNRGSGLPQGGPGSPVRPSPAPPPGGLPIPNLIYFDILEAV